MTTELLIILMLVLTCSALVLAPKAVAGILRLQIPCERWTRMIGFLGLLWVALALATSKSIAILTVPPTAKVGLTIARHYLGGGIVGLVFGLGARRQDGER
jgi:hypothetical protein